MITTRDPDHTDLTEDIGERIVEALERIAALPPAEPPVVKVDAPVVQVAAPVVKVALPPPGARTLLVHFTRDAAGNIASPIRIETT